MEFEYTDTDTGLKILFSSGQKHRCILSEIDAKVHGEPLYYNLLKADRDPTDKIHEAGWLGYEYEEKQHSQTVRVHVQLTDLFGAGLYLCTIPKNKQAVRENLYHKVRETLDGPEDDYYLELLKQVFHLKLHRHSS